MTKPQRPAARPTVLVDNAHLIATEWRFAPGAETGWHRHGHDYLVVPMTSNAVLLEEPGGTERRTEMVAGKPYFRNEGVEHNVINADGHELVFIEVELKKR
jgi:quercetin dioxygenase-like cupin family protein